METQTALYTKYVESEIPNDIELVDSLATLGWVMTGATYKIKEMAARIRELREITGLTVEEIHAITVENGRRLYRI